MKAKQVNLIIFTFLLSLLSIWGTANAMEKPDKEDVNIVLIGASIGKGWDFPDLPKRVGIDGYKLEYMGVFDSFDKTPAINKVLDRDQKPDAVIVKECSVYFPGDLESYKNSIMTWVSELRQKGITPILATSVPPGEPDSMWFDFKQFIKGLMGKPKKIDSVVLYNNWLRQYATDNKIKLFDLEKILRISDKNRHMKAEYDRGDHTHVNKNAYKVMDDNIKQFLLTMKKS